MHTGNSQLRLRRLITARNSEPVLSDRRDAVNRAYKRLRMADAVESAKGKLTVLEYNALALHIIRENDTDRRYGGGRK